MPPAAFRMRKRRASRRMIFSPPLPQKKKGEGALSSLRAATATRFSLPPTAPPSSTPSVQARWRVSVPPRFVRGMASIPSRFRILSLCAAIPPTRCPVHLGVGATGAATLLQRYGSLEAALKAGRFPAMAESLRLYQVDRHHEPKGSAAKPSQSKANLGQGGRTGARVGVEPARPSARGAWFSQGRLVLARGKMPGSRAGRKLIGVLVMGFPPPSLFPRRNRRSPVLPRPGLLIVHCTKLLDLHCAVQ